MFSLYCFGVGFLCLLVGYLTGMSADTCFIAYLIGMLIGIFGYFINNFIDIEFVEVDDN